MILVFEKMEQTIAASANWRLGIAGDMFRLTGAFWPVTVRLIKDNRIIGSMANMLKVVDFLIAKERAQAGS